MLTIAFLVIAILFAAVGQAGATGYIAAMGWAGYDPQVIRPVALFLNVAVALIGTLWFARSGLLSWRTFYPFGVLGFPFSIASGLIALPHRLYFPIVGVLLLIAALQLGRFALRGTPSTQAIDTPPPFALALITGAVVGFMSGLTGTGGGIFLAPILLFTGWVRGPPVAAVSAAYNLLNSTAALAGIAMTMPALPPQLPVWFAAVALGGAIGSAIAARWMPERALRGLLAVVLGVSAVKFLAG